MTTRAERGLYWDEAWWIVQGCTPVDRSCDQCWAAEYSHRAAGRLLRFHGVTKKTHAGTPFGECPCFTGEVRFDASQLSKPRNRRKPTIYAVWTDLFHRNLSDWMIGDAMSVMRECPRHRFLVCTKRIERAAQWEDWPSNLWLGTTIPTQAQIGRLEVLREIPAARKFVSLEPLLGPVHLKLTRRAPVMGCCPHGSAACPCMYMDEPVIDWAIIGCESGSRRRPCELDWVRGVVRQLDAASVKVWIKQLDLGGKVVKDMTQFPEDLRRREVPK